MAGGSSKHYCCSMCHPWRCPPRGSHGRKAARLPAAVQAQAAPAGKRRSAAPHTHRASLLHQSPPWLFQSGRRHRFDALPSTPPPLPRVAPRAAPHCCARARARLRCRHFRSAGGRCSQAAELRTLMPLPFTAAPRHPHEITPSACTPLPPCTHLPLLAPRRHTPARRPCRRLPSRARLAWAGIAARARPSAPARRCFEISSSVACAARRCALPPGSGSPPAARRPPPPACCPLSCAALRCASPPARRRSAVLRRPGAPREC